MTSKEFVLVLKDELMLSMVDWMTLFRQTALSGIMTMISKMTNVKVLFKLHFAKSMSFLLV